MKKCEVVMTVEQMQDRGAWLKARESGIGGSEISSVVGVNPWKSAYTLWAEKTHKVEPEDLSDNEKVYWGTVLEEVVATEFSRRTGKKVDRIGLMRSVDKPWMLASVDRVIVGEEVGLECKTADKSNAYQWEDDEVPSYYYEQCQWYMAVTGYNSWWIACLVGGNKFVFKEIPRNDEEIEILVSSAEAFWNENVLKGIPPEPSGDKDCSETIKKLYKGGGEEACEWIEEGKYDTVAGDIVALKAEIKKLEKTMKEKENLLKTQMQDRGFARTQHFNIYWKSSMYPTFDEKGLQRDHPAIYEKYVGKAPRRRFEIKTSKARADK